MYEIDRLAMKYKYVKTSDGVDFRIPVDNKIMSFHSPRNEKLENRLEEGKQIQKMFLRTSNLSTRNDKYFGIFSFIVGLLWLSTAHIFSEDINEIISFIAKILGSGMLLSGVYIYSKNRVYEKICDEDPNDWLDFIDSLIAEFDLPIEEAKKLVKK
ncbi:MAG: hypothetical protein RSB41_01195 [Bacilli bacterium]